MNKLASALIATMMIVTEPAFSLELEQIRIGATYYHDAWNNNNRVRVLGLNGNKVEIIFLEGSSQGEVDFVSASKLLSKSESKTEAADDAAQAVTLGLGLGALAFCLFTDCGDKEKTVPVDREIRFKNNCIRPLRLAVYSKNSKHDWGSNEWWTFPSGKQSYLSISNEGRLTTSSNQ